jgi:ATP-dependent protease ClpP protease subunit
LSWLQVVSDIPATRRLSIQGAFSNRDSEALLKQFSVLDAGEGDILCTIDSKGGNADAGLNVCSQFRDSPRRIIGLVQGHAMSAAFMALQGCTVRLATRQSELAIHDPRFAVDFHMPPVYHDTPEEEWISAQRQRFRWMQATITESRDDMLRILGEGSLLKERTQLAHFIAKGIKMSAGGAEALGFLDEVLDIADKT